MNFQRLFSLLRDGVSEITAYGEIVVTDGKKILFQTSEAPGRYPARSLLKPFQFMAAGIPLAKWEFSTGEKRYVAALGSVSATTEQVSQIREWYAADKFQLPITKLKFTSGFPMDETNRVRAKVAGEGPRPEFHTCFSKHMAILEACQARGWSLDDYTSTQHPFHQVLTQTLGDLLGEPGRMFQTVGDGCSLPSPVLTLAEMGELYRRLATEASGPLKAMRELMFRSPEWIGGPKRIDTRLMEMNSGELVAKEGADGLMGIGIGPRPGYPNGLGIVVKIASGFQPPLAAIAVDPLLEALELSPVHEVPRGQSVHFHYVAFEKYPNPIVDISPTLSDRIAVWPGDKPYRRTVTLDTKKGDHLTLSSIEATGHVGAHTDGPNHFLGSDKGIDQVPPGKYWGACQVIAVKKKPGECVMKADVAGVKIQAPRILFKTDSYPDSEKFNSDFNALSAELITYLASQGVTLVGVDTPSIDPFESKTMDAHRATVATQMSILEGIVLSTVEPGIYELIAIPLKIEDGDSSPVRALLRPQ